MSRRRIIGIALLAAFVLALAFAPAFASSYQILIAFEILQIAALAQAWSLLAGYGGIVSLATSAFVGIGAYAAAELSVAEGLPFEATVVISGLASVVLALIISIPMFRFRGPYFTIATLVLSVGLRIFFSNSAFLGGSGGIFLQGEAPSDTEIYLVSLFVTVLATAAVWWIRSHRLGLGLSAIRDDEDVASRMGVPVFRVKLTAFLVSSFLMGMVGGISAVRIGSVQPSSGFDFNWTIDTINAAIIGGVGTLVGPILGSVAAVALSEGLRNFPALHLVFTGIILIVVIRVLPAGVWGTVARALRNRGFFDRRSRTAPVAPAPLLAPPAQMLGAGKTLMEVRGVGKSFGGVPAVTDVSFEIRSGEVLGIVGPNGAGKSTLIGLLSGAVVGTGSVVFVSEDITRLDARDRARRGIGRTHQVPRPFDQLTVLDNLMVARRYAGATSLKEDTAECRAILERCGLLDFEHTLASDLGLLRLKRLELARALALRPRLLLLDEIGAGLVASEVDELIDLIADLRSEIESIVVVEHVLDVIRRCCDRLVVINRGEKLLEGAPDEVLKNDKVAEVYLGTAAAAAAEVSRAPRAGGGVPHLEARNLEARYGKHLALHDVSLQLDRGQILTILGSNGAGKSTLAKTLSGSLRATHGEIVLAGRAMEKRPTYEFVRRGIAHCMEGRRIFGDLSVEENLLLGGRSARRRERLSRLAEIYRLFPDLEEKRRNPGVGLSGGQQQMLAIGRALMSGPELVIFDEISLGLAPITVERLYTALAELNERTGLSMIVIEQNIERGLSIADHVIVLEKGTVALTGTPEEIRASPELRALYVG
jgi:branched-chain amino acid transport system ATP-binding protein